MLERCPTCGQYQPARISGHDVAFHNASVEVDGVAFSAGRLRQSEINLIRALAELHIMGREWVAAGEVHEALYPDPQTAPSGTNVIKVLVCTSRQKLDKTPVRIETVSKKYRLSVHPAYDLNADEGDKQHRRNISEHV